MWYLVSRSTHPGKTKFDCNNLPDLDGFRSMWGTGNIFIAYNDDDNDSGNDSGNDRDNAQQSSSRPSSAAAAIFARQQERYASYDPLRDASASSASQPSRSSSDEQSAVPSSSYSSSAAAAAAFARQQESVQSVMHCCITRDLLVDPVIAADGETYERAAITAWFDTGHFTSPKTRAVITTALISNHAIRRLAVEARLAANLQSAADPIESAADAIHSAAAAAIQSSADPIHSAAAAAIQSSADPIHSAAAAAIQSSADPIHSAAVPAFASGHEPHDLTDDDDSL
jgi:hypothetical protein